VARRSGDLASIEAAFYLRLCHRCRRTELFDVDSDSPLTFRTRRVEEQKHGQLIDFSYRADHSEGYASAWLIAPNSPANFSYVVFLHGGGQNRGAFIQEAQLLAENGIIALLIDLPQARVFPRFTNPEDELSTFQETVSVVRRGIDCLGKHFQMDDRARGAIIGFSFGAWIGVLLAAADRRLKAAALAAFTPRMSEFWRVSLHPEVIQIRTSLPESTVARYADVTRSIDAIEQLGQRDELQLFLQFGSRDEFVPEQDIREFLPFVDGSNLLRIYESDSHLEMFLNAAARRDRLSWMQEQLLK
jgi:dienelactone hydrolase